MVIKKTVSIWEDVDKLIMKKWTELLQSGDRNATYSKALNLLIRESEASTTITTIHDDTTTYPVSEGED